MEIVFEHVSYHNALNDISIKITSNNITGIYHNHDLIKLLKNPKLVEKGMITINDEKYKYNNKLVSIINYKEPFYTARVIDEILFNAKIRGYQNDNIKTKIESLLDELGLDRDILNKVVHTLSTTEKYLIKIVANLIYEPRIIIFERLMDNLDAYHQKKWQQLIMRLKNEDKIIIISSNKCDTLYDITDEIIIVNKAKLLIQGKTDDVYTKEIKLLLKNKIDVPSFPLLTYLASTKKNVNLFYRKDVRDVIKDVYKSVS